MTTTSSAASCSAAALCALLALLLLSVAGCGGTQEATGEQEATTIEVENQGRSRAVVYVLRGTRFRLGAVEAAGAETFTVPPGFVSGTTTLRFVAAPLGGGAEVSREITVRPGDAVGMTILP